MTNDDLTPDQVYVLKYLYRCQLDGKVPQAADCGLPLERVDSALLELERRGLISRAPKQ